MDIFGKNGSKNDRFSYLPNLVNMVYNSNKHMNGHSLLNKISN